MKMTVLSCIQPTAELHIGNYFGAISNWVRLQEEYNCIYGVVDLHAMTKEFDPEQLRGNTERMLLDLIACGLDPERSILFLQSLVPEHTELCWLLACCCSYGDLTRQTQFKDQMGKDDEARVDRFVSAGFFVYPVLQAADILIYKANYVPVGQDQRQHLELARQIASRFNRLFGELFPEPHVLVTDTPKVYSLADPTKKMSKSLGPQHYVGVFEDPEGIRAKVQAAVTDSGTASGDEPMSPGVSNLFELLNACGKVEEAASLLNDYERGIRKYARLKEAVADGLIEMTTGFRTRRRELEGDHGRLRALVDTLSGQARDIAWATLAEVRTRMGLPARPHYRLKVG